MDSVLALIIVMLIANRLIQNSVTASISNYLPFVTSICLIEKNGKMQKQRGLVKYLMCISYVRCNLGCIHSKNIPG
jgi:hypothetical protein